MVSSAPSRGKPQQAGQGAPKLKMGLIWINVVIKADEMNITMSPEVARHFLQQVLIGGSRSAPKFSFCIFVIP